MLKRKSIEGFSVSEVKIYYEIIIIKPNMNIAKVQNYTNHNYL